LPVWISHRDPWDLRGRGEGSPRAPSNATLGKTETYENGAAFRGKITATRETGRKVKTLIGTVVDRQEQYLPARYNRQSELTAEVTAEGPNRFEFDLVSD